jgi:hypothetical protein
LTHKETRKSHFRCEEDPENQKKLLFVTAGNVIHLPWLLSIEDKKSYTFSWSTVEISGASSVWGDRCFYQKVKESGVLKVFRAVISTFT